MPDHRLVQCFGIKRRPGKEAKYCRRSYQWTAKGIAGNFGGAGVQACPYCGTMPDFKHPTNRWYNGEFKSAEEAQAAMVIYEENLKNRK